MKASAISLLFINEASVAAESGNVNFLLSGALKADSFCVIRDSIGAEGAFKR